MATTKDQQYYRDYYTKIQEKDLDFGIVVVDNGFVFLGEYNYSEDDNLQLGIACMIREYGTVEGLGQLAIEGPQKETVMDPVPVGLMIPGGRVVFCMPCDQEKWTS